MFETTSKSGWETCNRIWSGGGHLTGRGYFGQVWTLDRAGSIHRAFFQQLTALAIDVESPQPQWDCAKAGEDL